jgi:peptide subunit release factor 1 (eRF1)
VLATKHEMTKSSPSLDTPLADHLRNLAAFEPQNAPVVSLYLNLAPDQHGRDNYEAFCRRAFADQLRALTEHPAAHASLARDIQRITSYLADEVTPSANGLAIFSSAGAGDYFVAVQLDVPIDDHWLFISRVPHLYPLVRLIDQYPRYASVVLDTNQARILVFGLRTIEKRKEVKSVKTRRNSMGGWSQARYQRRAENFHLHHVKEVVETLDRVVRGDNIQHIIVLGDDVVVPLLKEALPAHLTEKLLDVGRADRHASEDDIVAETLDILRQKDADTDREKVAELVDTWRSGGLGVVGPEATLRALLMGQVEELLIVATADALKPVQQPLGDAPGPVATETSAPSAASDKQLQLSDELVTRAQQTGARVRIIEDPELLREHGGRGCHAALQNLMVQSRWSFTMSRKNKVNPDYYKVAGRLAPDDLARERMKQGMAKTARDSDERTKESPASTGRGDEPSDEAEAAVPSSTRWPAGASRSAKRSANTQMKKSAAGTKKKPVSTRSAATKPARRAAAGKKTFGSKKTSRRTAATR